MFLRAPTIVSSLYTRHNMLRGARDRLFDLLYHYNPRQPFQCKTNRGPPIKMPSGAIDQEIASRLSEDLGALEQLRALLQGNEEISIPGVVVAGSQSAGESSVLEALGGMKLPRGQTITTACRSFSVWRPFRSRNLTPSSAGTPISPRMARRSKSTTFRRWLRSQRQADLPRDSSSLWFHPHSHRPYWDYAQLCGWHTGHLNRNRQPGEEFYLGRERGEPTG